MTGRSGQATAAPAAIGRPCPIAPPVTVSQSCGGAPAVAPPSPSPEVFDSSLTMAPSGSSAPITAAAVPASSGPSGTAGRAGGSEVGLASAATRSASAASAPGHVVARSGQQVDLGAVGHQRAGLARIAEERHRGACPGQDQVPGPGQLGDGHLGQVGQPARPGAARRRVPSGPGTSRPAACPGGGRDPAGRLQALPVQRVPAQQDQRGLVPAQDRGRRVDDRPGRRRGRPERERPRGLGAVGPGQVGRHDQVAMVPPRPRPRRPRPRPGQVPGVQRAAHPAGHRPGQRVDVGLQRRVVALVVGGVVADHADQGSAGPPGIVQPGQAVAQAGPEVQQGRRRAARSSARTRRPPRWPPPRTGTAPPAAAGT